MSEVVEYRRMTQLRRAAAQVTSKEEGEVFERNAWCTPIGRHFLGTDEWRTSGFSSLPPQTPPADGDPSP